MTLGGRLLNPTDLQLLAALRPLIEPPAGDRHGPSLADALRAIWREPQGVAAWSDRPDDDWRQALAAWWTDPVGRRHVAIEKGYGLAPEGVHPLTWVAPPLSAGWRERDGRRDFVVICRCGVAGTPEALSWMGQCCGPCHGREQEGLPPLGPAALREYSRGGASTCLLPSGRLVAVSVGPAPHTVRLWGSIDAETPAWEIRSPQFLHPFAENGRRIATVARTGEVLILNSETGTAVSRFPAGFQYATDDHLIGWSGAGGRLLIAGWDSIADMPEVAAVGISPSGQPQGHPTRLYKADGSTGRPAFSPCGQFFVVCDEPDLELRESADGEVIEVLSTPCVARATNPTILPDGSVVAFLDANPDGQSHLARWSPSRRRHAARGFLGWPTRPAAREPDQVIPADCVYKIIAAPNGEIATMEFRKVAARCATTLALRASFSQDRPDHVWTLSFTPDGRLLAVTDEGLAVWPWRELMGEPSPGSVP